MTLPWKGEKCIVLEGIRWNCNLDFSFWGFSCGFFSPSTRWNPKGGWIERKWKEFPLETFSSTVMPLNHRGCNPVPSPSPSPWWKSVNLLLVLLTSLLITLIPFTTQYFILRPWLFFRASTIPVFWYLTIPFDFLCLGKFPSISFQSVSSFM